MVTLVALSMSSDLTQAQRARAGVLNCDVSAGIGFIIGSSRTVSCVFTPDIPGPQEGYYGNISKFGLDIGATAGGQMVWAVFTDTTRGYGFLAGDYAGARAGPSRCNRSRCRDRSASISRSVSPISACGRRADPAFPHTPIT
jgi:hypothetical protein